MPGGTKNRRLTRFQSLSYNSRDLGNGKSGEIPPLPRNCKRSELSMNATVRPGEREGAQTQRGVSQETGQIPSIADVHGFEGGPDT